MKLMTKAIQERLLKNSAAAMSSGKTAESAPLKLFDPSGRFTMYVFDAHGEGDDLRLYGFVVSPIGPDCDEWGYASLNELASVRGALGLGIERDLHFSGVTAEQINEGARP